MAPQTWGWTGFGLIIMAITLAGIWAVAQWFEWLAPGYGAKILMVCLILLPLGVALFAGSNARKAFFGRDSEGSDT
jgi:hypothetical protein